LGFIPKLTDYLAETLSGFKTLACSRTSAVNSRYTLVRIGQQAH
jgi:hypothetical protein